MNDSQSHSPRLVPGTKAGRVWKVADELTARTGRRATRRQVIDAMVAEGGNSNTASTQYAYWKRDHDRKRGSAVSTEPGSVGKTKLQVGGNGRLLIPAEMRSAMLIETDGTVSARVENGELRIIAPRVALQRLQSMVRELDRGAGSVVDELIRERKEEAKHS